MKIRVGCVMLIRGLSGGRLTSLFESWQNTIGPLPGFCEDAQLSSAVVEIQTQIARQLQCALFDMKPFTLDGHTRIEFFSRQVTKMAGAAGLRLLVRL